MHAEILAIGSEILLGEIVDTNSAFIARKLSTIGLPLHYTSVVGDHLDRLVAAIKQGLTRSDVLITTGGLGPTVDDLTREAMSLAVGRPLVFDPALLEQIEARFRRFGRAMGDNNRRQAYRPEASLAIENPVGTAPCFVVEAEGHIAISLPGVPREMEYLMDQAVLPFLRQRFNLTGVIKSRALKIAGVGESQIDEQVGDLEKLENPMVGLNAQAGVIVVRITATAASDAEADALIAPVEATVRERLGALVFGADDESLEGVVLAGLDLRGQTLAVLESGTGGRLSSKLAMVAAQNSVFVGGRILGESAVSSIAALAQQAACEAQAHWGLACAIMEGELALGLWDGRQGRQWRRGFAGHPALASEWASNVALDALRKALSAE